MLASMMLQIALGSTQMPPDTAPRVSSAPDTTVLWPGCRGPDVAMDLDAGAADAHEALAAMARELFGGCKPRSEATAADRKRGRGAVEGPQKAGSAGSWDDLPGGSAGGGSGSGLREAAYARARALDIKEADEKLV